MGITRARTALACVVAAISLAVVVAPTASAVTPPTTKKQERRQNIGIRKAATAIKTLKKTAGILGADIKHAQSQVDVLVALSNALPPILTQLGDGLTALKNGLTTVGAALQDPTTGLVGLNNARPQFGAFDKNGKLIDGTGAHPPAKGPSGDATRTGAGTYVVDFGNDVSTRFWSLTLFPTGSLGLIGSTVSCASASAPCGGSNTSPDRLLVLWQNPSTGAPTDPANGFEVAAISG